VDLINALLVFLSQAPQTHVLVDDFFLKLEIWEIFAQHFAKPAKVFYFEALKEDVLSNLRAFVKPPKQQ